MEWREVRDDLLKNQTVRAAYEQKKPQYELIKQLIEQRKKLNLTQADLAKRLGTTQSVIARLESGAGNATIRTISRMADVLGCILKLEPKGRA